jgi:predicted lipoprotein with Yx(FWY)xxD motif
MKNMGICYSLLLIAFLFSAASAQQIAEIETSAGSVNTTVLKELITESERNLESYRFTLAQDQSIEIINLSEGNTTHQDRHMAIGSGAFNLTDRTVKVVTASLYYPVGQEENSNAITTEMYLLNNTLYNKVDCNWTTVNLSLPENVLMNQNRLNRSAELTNASEVRLLGTVIEGDEGFYIVEVTPNSSAVSSLISQELGTSFSISSINSSINLSALFNNTKLRYVLWISIDSHIPIAEYVQTNMTITPEMLGQSLDEPGKGNTEIHIDSITLLRFSGFNKSVNIVLPEQAKRAVTMPLNNSQILSVNVSSPDPSSSPDPISSPDPVSFINSSSLTPEMQQQLWLAEAYSFLNGNYYTYGSPLYSPTYSSTYMPDYLSSYYPYYIPYYSPYYTPYYTSYTSSYQGYTPVTLGYTTPAQGYATPVQGYTAQGYTIMTASNPSLGTYLTDGRGMTLYHLLSDQGSYTSKCTDATCTGIWPPFYTAAINIPANLNLNLADFGTITVNGYKQYQQTTYKGWPLYYYYKDIRPGDTYGQSLTDSYGVWSVVSPQTPSTFPANFQYQPSGAAVTQNQYPAQTPSTITLSPSPPAYTTPSLYPVVPTPRQVTTPLSGSVPVTVRYPGPGPFDVYLDGSYVGTGTGGSFSFSAPAGYHDVRVWDGNFDYEQIVLFVNGVSKIINVEAV